MIAGFFKYLRQRLLMLAGAAPGSGSRTSSELSQIATKIEQYRGQQDLGAPPLDQPPEHDHRDDEPDRSPDTNPRVARRTRSLR